MKIADIRDLTPDEIVAQIETLTKELFEARFQKATNQLEDTAVFKRKRHLIAQLQTVLNQKQAQSKGEAVHA